MSGDRVGYDDPAVDGDGDVALPRQRTGDDHRPGGDDGERVLALWCADWPVTAAAAAQGLSIGVPAAVFSANRVVVASASARAHGVRRGQRRREAQGRCPDLAVLAHDADRDARAFEPVVAAVEALAPGVEVVRPGLVVVAARGPAGYFGDETKAAERLVDVVAAQVGVECQVGVADGMFAATAAAYRGLVVPAGATPAFLAPLGIGELSRAAEYERVRPNESTLVDLLHRLGLRTLGAFAALDSGEVATRFGPAGARAHRLARGSIDRSPVGREIPADLDVVHEWDPPVERVDHAAFAAREPAERLHGVLAARGLACVRLSVSVRTEIGEELTRVWRCSEPLSAAGIADRVRWQLDGWLSAPVNRPTSGIVRLHLAPDEIVGGGALQRGLWGESGVADERATRAVARVQGMLGPEAVISGILAGGRDPVARVRTVSWGAAVDVDRVSAGETPPPWPGRLPAPSPTRVPLRPWPAEVLDDTGQVVSVSARGDLSGVPYRVSIDGRPPRRVLSWAGPWPVTERWWEPDGGRRRARVQAVLDAEPDRRGVPTDAVVPDDDEAGDGGIAVLLCREQERWWVEGVYE